jgi:hypothetical protein
MVVNSEQAVSAASNQNPAQSVENVKHLILDGIFPLGKKTRLNYTVMEAAEKENYVVWKL